MEEKLEPRGSDLDHLSWLKHGQLDSFAGKRILDLGCGSGYICRLAMQEGAKSAVGIDILPPEFRDDSWTFSKVDLDSPSWHSSFDQSFDLILAFDIVEHLHSPSYFLTSCYESLNAGGSIVITTPNQLSWERFVKPDSWSGVQDEQHKILFSKYSLEFLLKKIGYNQIYTCSPMRSLSFMKFLQPQIGGQIFCTAQK